MTEAEMCAAFTQRARARGFLVYPETGGFDLLLVWGGEAPFPHVSDERNEIEYSWQTDWIGGYTQMQVPEYAQGDQIGVEAKLKPGLPVLSQLLKRYRWVGSTAKGPNFFALLTTPEKTDAMKVVCNALGIGVYAHGASAAILFPKKRHHFGGGKLWVPPVEPTFSGGHPAPKTLSQWRVGALRIMALLRTRGWVESTDFEAAGIAKGAWVTRRWIQGYWHSKAPKQYRYRIVPDQELKSARKGLSALPDAGYEAERDAMEALIKC